MVNGAGFTENVVYISVLLIIMIDDRQEGQVSVTNKWVLSCCGDNHEIVNCWMSEKVSCFKIQRFKGELDHSIISSLFF